jgi:hypothetical protein
MNNSTLQRIEKIKDIALELTMTLGQVVTAEITDYWPDYLHIEGGGILGISFQDNHRFHVWASAPEGNKGPNVYDHPEIHLSQDRTSAAIAQDITRRLEPAAHDYWQKCREAAAQRQQQQATVKAVTDELAAHGMTVRLDTDETRAHVYTPNANAEVYSSGNVSDFRIGTLTLAQALQILGILEAKQ